ncbi:unnamed protein product [Cuscuta epithymum]|uniref:C2H2-type domain-containing protein n=1 Tax=Cuscuta epithymum TaxID=186058 RepID=A0AAV0C9F5_9ASTE|nr:unnamed protein product [Cuscuta epithymum]
MEFWGAEVKSGQPLAVELGMEKILHLSQANIGEVKKEKGPESICLYVTVDDKKYVLATLNTEKLPQQQFDLYFERDITISHNWKNGSVYFHGYVGSDEMSDDEDDTDTEEPLQIETKAANGKPLANEKNVKPSFVEKEDAAKGSAAGKKKVKISEPKKGVEDDKEDESSGEDNEMEDDDDDSDSGASIEDESDSEEEDSEEEEAQETPKKVESGKKRQPESSAKKTPVPAKKVKLTTPQQKTDGKKGNTHVATPHPSKKTEKTPLAQKTPKSGGSHQCKECNRTFGSESALGSHSQAKHIAGK